MIVVLLPPPPSRVTVLEPPVQMPVNQVNQLNQQKHQLSTAPCIKLDLFMMKEC